MKTVGALPRLLPLLHRSPLLSGDCSSAPSRVCGSALERPWPPADTLLGACKRNDPSARATPASLDPVSGIASQDLSAVRTSKRYLSTSQLASASLEGSTSQSDPAIGTTSSAAVHKPMTTSAGARWYARQAAKQVLTQDDLQHLYPTSEGENVRHKTSQARGGESRRHVAVSPSQTTDMQLEKSVALFFGLMSSSESPHSKLEDLFRSLSLEAKAFILRSPSRGQVSALPKSGIPCETRPYPGTTVFSRKEMMTCFLETFPQNKVSGTASYRLGVVAPVVLAISAEDSVVLGQELMCRILSLTLYLLGEVTKEDSVATAMCQCSTDMDGLLQRVLFLGEEVALWNGPFAEKWCTALEQGASLSYEACAYRSAAGLANGVLLEPQRGPSRLGVGGRVSSFLDTVPRLLMSLNAEQCDVDDIIASRWQSLTQAMPPQLRRFTRDLSLQSLVRSVQELRIGSANLGGSWTPPSCFAGDQDELQLHSHLHFVLGCGSASSAAAMLAQCRTPLQIAATMRYTRNAGAPLSIEAATRLLSLRVSGKVYIVVRFGRSVMSGGTGKRTSLAIEVRREGASFQQDTDPSAPRDFSVTPIVALPRQYAKAVRFAVYAAAPWLANDDSVTLDTAVLALPASAVPLAVRSLGTAFTSQVVSWWATVYMRQGRRDQARAMLEAAGMQDLLPDMGVFVLMLESCADNEDALREAVALIETHFAAVADTIFRAFVERTASRGQRNDVTGKPTLQAATRLLSTVALLGLRHYPPSCLEVIAEESPSPTVAAVLHLTEEVSRRVGTGARRTPAALHSDTVARLVDALEELGLRPVLDVYAITKASHQGLWWCSDSWCPPPPQSSQLRITEHLYRTGAVALWPLAEQELLWQNGTLKLEEDNMFLHKALRVVGMGCREDGQRVVRLFEKHHHLLFAPSESRHSSTGCGRHRSSSVRELRLMHTIAFLADVLSRNGYWEEAMGMFPHTSPIRLPPLLKVVRLMVIQRNPGFSQFGVMSLDTEARTLVRELQTREMGQRQRAWREQPQLRRRRRFASKKRRSAAIAGDPKEKHCDPARELYECLCFPRPLARLLHSEHNSFPHA